jgi:hypothetical protein
MSVRFIAARRKLGAIIVLAHCFRVITSDSCIGPDLVEHGDVVIHILGTDPPMQLLAVGIHEDIRRHVVNAVVLGESWFLQGVDFDGNKAVRNGPNQFWLIKHVLFQFTAGLTTLGPEVQEDESLVSFRQFSGLGEVGNPGNAVLSSDASSERQTGEKTDRQEDMLWDTHVCGLDSVPGLNVVTPNIGRWCVRVATKLPVEANFDGLPDLLAVPRNARGNWAICDLRRFCSSFRK